MSKISLLDDKNIIEVLAEVEDVDFEVIDRGYTWKAQSKKKFVENQKR